MVYDCTGLPPGELMRMITPWVFLSLNAACSALLIFSALASAPGEMMPFNSTIAVCFFPPERSARPSQSISATSRKVTYAKVRNLKKMPQRRRRLCSARASVASFVTRSRSQEVLLSVICESFEVNVAVALFHQNLHQWIAAAGAADAAAGFGLVRRAVRGAEKIAPVGIEKYSFLPVEFHLDVRAAVEIAVNRPVVAHDKRRRPFAEVFDLEAHALAGV